MNYVGNTERLAQDSFMNYGGYTERLAQHSEDVCCWPIREVEGRCRWGDGSTVRCVAGSPTVQGKTSTEWSCRECAGEPLFHYPRQGWRIELHCESVVDGWRVDQVSSSRPQKAGESTSEVQVPALRPGPSEHDDGSVAAELAMNP